MPSASPNGKQLLSATYDLLRQDKQMFALPFVGSVFGIVAGLILFAPGYALGWVMNGHERVSSPTTPGQPWVASGRRSWRSSSRPRW